MNPEFADETPVNPFDMWEGANFKLKIRNVEGYRNYDKSEFADKSALFDGDDDKLEELWKSEFSLKEFTEKKQFKSYDQLKARLDKALGIASVAAVVSSAATASLDEDEEVSSFDSSGSDDEDLDYFKSLASQD
jgi:mevalonate pyrophosphate decarboxylase